jgi:hypothetical protein
MNISLSATEYVWYQYNGAKATKTKYEKASSETKTFELDFVRGNVFGVRSTKDAVYLVDFDNQKIEYATTQAEVDRLIGKTRSGVARSVVFKGKGCTPKYKWFKYDGAKIVIDYEEPEDAIEVDLTIAKGQVIGVRVMNNGDAYLKSQEDQAKKYKIPKKYIDSLLLKCVKHGGVTSKEPKTILNTGIKFNKDDSNAYVPHQYSGAKALAIYNFSGIKAGTIHPGEIYGLQSQNLTLGGFFRADVTVKDKNLRGVVVKLDADELADLILSGEKLVDKTPKKEELVPTIEPQNGKLSVAKLKPLQKNVAELNQRLITLTKRRCTTLDEYNAIKSEMKVIRDVDYPLLKDHMHELGLDAVTADILISAIHNAWDLAISLIGVKKRSALRKARKEEKEEISVTPGPIGPMIIGDEPAGSQTPLEILTQHIAALKDKSSELSIAADADEVKSIMRSFTTLYHDAEEAVITALPNDGGDGVVARQQKYLNKLLAVYDKAIANMTAKIKLFETPLDEDDTEWDDANADIPTEDFTPLDEDETSAPIEPTVVEPVVPTPLEVAEQEEAEEEMDDDYLNGPVDDKRKAALDRMLFGDDEDDDEMSPDDESAIDLDETDLNETSEEEYNDDALEKFRDLFPHEIGAEPEQPD